MERIFIRDLCDLRAESVLESGGINDLLMTGWSVKSIQQIVIYRLCIHLFSPYAILNAYLTH